MLTQHPLKQCASTVLMVRPLEFGPNPEAAASNVFMTSARCEPEGALAAFDRLADALSDAGVECLVHHERGPASPDAIFPNNWFSTHENGSVVLYPMATSVRRLERQGGALESLSGSHKVERCIDMTECEARGQFLEGTGSLVLDRTARVAYACPSSRTDPSLVSEWCRALGYQPRLFDASVGGVPVYHTNVVLAVGEGFAIIGSECVSEKDRKGLLSGLSANGREIFEVSEGQVREFAANLLQVQGRTEKVIALSTRALEAYSPKDRSRLERHGRLSYADLSPIEDVSGGSARCMLAEVFLQPS